MAFQKPLPEWKQPGIRPPESKIKEGYQVLDKPPAAWMNWQMNTTYEALEELQDKAAEKEDVSQALGEAKAYTDEKTKNLEAPVKSVNSKTGDVVLTAADITGDNGDFSVPGNITSGKQVSATGGFVTPKDVHARDIATSRNLVVSGETNLSSRVFMVAPTDASINPELWFYKGDVKRGVLWTSMAGNSNSINLRPQKSDGTNAPGLALTEDGRMMYNGRDVMAEIDSAKQSGVDARSKIAGAINAKGVPASANDDFSTLASKIGQIKMKIKDLQSAKGSTNGQEKIEIDNLDFEPLIIRVDLRLSVYRVGVRAQGWYVKGINDSYYIDFYDGNESYYGTTRVVWLPRGFTLNSSTSDYRANLFYASDWIAYG